MRVQRAFLSVSKFFSRLCTVLVKTVAASMILGVGLVLIMHYMGVPIPTAGDLLRGVSRLAKILS
jgi:ABC-type multidrug transport system permease subunit